MSRTFTIKELNEKIDNLIAEYEKDREMRVGYPDDILAAKIESLEELKVELNDPNPVVNVTEKIQESLNIIETNKIINDGL